MGGKNITFQYIFTPPQTWIMLPQSQPVGWLCNSSKIVTEETRRLTAGPLNMRDY